MAIIFLISFVIPTQHAGAVNPEDIRKLSQASARLTAEYLKQTVDEKSGLWVPPRIHKNYAPSSETVDVMVPIYKIVGYEDIWVWERSPTEDDPYRKIHKKIKRPIKKKIGEKKGKHRKRSDVVSSESHYIPRFAEGLNALGAYALLHAGESPDTPQLQNILEWLEHMAMVGLPDNTAELSLMLMVFLNANPAKYEEIIERGITKLLYGQIDSGAGRGQWGYYSVNWDVLKILQRQSEILSKFKGVIRNLNTNKDYVTMSNKEKAAYLKKVELDGAISWLNKRTKDASREFPLGRLWWRVRVEEIQGEIYKKYYRWAQTLYDARELRLGNLPNTEIALRALSEAHGKGWFESENQAAMKRHHTYTLRRFGKKLKAPSPPKLTTVIARTAAMLQKYQKPSGEWDLCISRVRTKNPYEQMKEMKVEPTRSKTPERVKRHVIDPADPALLGTLSAIHSFSLISKMIGRDRVGKKYGGSINKGKVAYEKLLESYLRDVEIVPENKHVFLPYRFWLTIPSIKDNIGLKSLASTEHEWALIRKIVGTQNADGSFSSALGKEFRNRFMPLTYFPVSVQETWVKEKVEHDRHTYPHIDPRFINSALALIFYGDYLKDDVLGPEEWLDVLDYFLLIRESPLGSRMLSEEEPEVKGNAPPKEEEKEAELIVPPEPKEEPLEEDETF